MVFRFSPTQITEALELSNIRDRKWTIVESDAKLGKGLKEGFDWLAQELNPQNRKCLVCSTNQPSKE